MSKPTYTPTTWIDHVEDPATGEVTTLGTEVNAAHLNNMEQGIQDAINAIGQTDADLSGRDAKAEFMVWLRAPSCLQTARGKIRP